MMMMMKKEKNNILNLYFHLVLKGLNFLYKTILVPLFLEHLKRLYKRCYFIMQGGIPRCNLLFISTLGCCFIL